jgi:hypothetical protein
MLGSGEAVAHASIVCFPRSPVYYERHARTILTESTGPSSEIEHGKVFWSLPTTDRPVG